jgi:hypothetical protein
VFIKQPISVGKLLLNVRNYRIVAQDSQKGARDAIIAEQSKKLVVLSKDIVENGLSPFDLLMVVDAEDGDQNYIVIEGNRRLTAIKLMLDPELAKDTPLHAAFVKLNKQHADAIPKVLDCTIAPNRKVALMWGNRKHASGLEGAGTEPWTAMAKARAEMEQGIPSPALDVVNFVLTNTKLDADLRHHLEGSQFNLTTLNRLVTTKELQEAADLKLSGGQLRSKRSKEWLQKVLIDVVTTIASGKRNGKKWTERDIDSQGKRESFAKDLVDSHPGAKKVAGTWIVSGNPKAAAPEAAKPPKPKGTPSTEDQPNLIPKKFRLELPAGKINDIFVELKKLDVDAYRHSISVLFRVFFEFTLDEFIKKRKIELPKDRDGHEIDTLKVRLSRVLKDVKDTGLLKERELKPVNVAVSDRNSMLHADTLNAYVHSKWMNPDPLQLKLTWANFQLFIERLWMAK